MRSDAGARAAEQALVRHALERGYLTQSQVAQAQRELFAAPPGTRLVQVLQERYLKPQHLSELEAVYAGELSRHGSAIQVTLAPPAQPSPAQDDSATFMTPAPGTVNAAPVTFATPIDETSVGAPSSSTLQSSSSSLAREGWIGEYRIVRELARGGFGVVYVAHSPGLDREVAVKVLHPHTGNQALERFGIEARAAASLKHANIVGIHHVGEDVGKPYLVMDLIPGRSLKELLESGGPLEPRRAARITRSLANALYYAHQRWILHRDLKPDNVILREDDDEPVLTDFGLAKDVRAEGVTVSGQVMGTPAYMSPEQAGGEQDQVDRRSDIYSLGATLYHLLTGRAPFTGESQVNILTQVFRDEPPAPSSLRPGLDSDLETVCLKCLEKEPEQRYGSMEELAQDLDRLLKHRPILARRPTALDRGRKWIRRNPTLFRVVVGAATLLLLGGVLAVVQIQTTKSESRLREVSAAADAAEQERRQLADEAAEQTRLALSRLAEHPEGDDPQLLEQRTSLALEAYVSAQRWHGLARDDPKAAQARYQAACALGAVNRRAEQWLLAVQAYEDAVGLGVDDDEAARLLSEVRAARAAKQRERAEAVERTLAKVTGGKLRDRGAIDDAIFQLVRHAHEDTLPIILDRLKSITRRLLESEQRVFQEAIRDSDQRDELNHFMEAIRLVQRSRAARRDLPGAPEAIRARRQAVPLVFTKYRKETGNLTPSRLFLERLVGNRQTVDLGQEAVLATVITRALGQLIRFRAESKEPLFQYLFAEADEGRARWAGLSLCKLFRDDLDTLRPVFGAKRRFGARGPFAQELRPYMILVREVIDLPQEEWGASEWTKRAQNLVAEGDRRGALEAMNRAVELAPQELHLRHRRAILKRDLKDYDGSVADFTAVLKGRPSDMGALVERANVLRLQGQLQRAIADCKRALKLDPQEERAWLYMAGALAQGSRDKEAIQALTRALELNASLVPAWFNRAMLRLRTGDLEGAEEDVARALELAPTDPGALRLQGRIHLKRGSPTAAIATFTQATERNPRDPEARALLGLARLKAGDRAGAQRELAKALRLNPNSRQALALKAHLRGEGLPGSVDKATRLTARADRLRGQRRLREALSVYQESLRINPDQATTWTKLARLQIELRDYEGALRSAQALADIGIPLAQAWGAAMRGEVMFAKRDFKGALSAFKEATKKHDDEGAHWNRLGVAYYMLNDQRRAAEAYSRAIQRRPDQAGFWFNRGTSRMALGKDARALEDFDKAIELDPKIAGAWVNRGLIRARQGNLRAAIADLEQGLSLAPNHPSAGHVRRTIRELKAKLN